MERDIIEPHEPEYEGYRFQKRVLRRLVTTAAGCHMFMGQMKEAGRMQEYRDLKSQYDGTVRLLYDLFPCTIREIDEATKHFTIDPWERA